MYRVLQFGMTPSYGGVEAFIMNLYRNIDRSKIQFDFWVTAEQKIAYEDEILDLGGRIIRPKYHSRKENLVKHYKEIIMYFRNSSETIAIHLNKAMIQEIDLLIIAKFVHVPVRIIHSHIAFNPSKMNKLEQLNQKLLPYFATDFLACSEDAGNYMFGNNQATVIKDGVDIGRYKFSHEIRKKIRSQLGIQQETFVIGSIGRFSKQKNTLFLIDLFKHVHNKEKNTKLLLLGDGFLREQVEEKIRGYNLKDSIILMGEIKDANDYYSAMDMFLLPSVYEGFGMVLLEAQINGLPCIAAKDGIPDLVNVTKRVKFISLQQSMDIWVDAIISYKKMERYDEIDKIIRAGFDSSEIASKLEIKYLRKVL